MPGTRKALQTLEVFTVQPVDKLGTETLAWSNPR